MNAHTRLSGKDAFIERFCSMPEELKAAFDGSPRLVTVPEGGMLCRQGDLANGVWIVEDGFFSIRHDHSITERRWSELIGEAAFYRLDPEGRPPYRAADVVARSKSSAWVIDRSLIDALPEPLKLAWTEAVARALVAKLDEATAQRVGLAGDVGSMEGLARRFVCEEGMSAALAMLKTGSAEIRPHRTQAVVWFSDVAGFSAHAERMAPGAAGELLKSFMNVQVEEIHNAGGHVDKFMGDGLMAFWLCPDETRIASTVEAAAQAAVSSGRRLRELIAASGHPLDIRIGMHLGEVSVGDFGGSERIAFTLVGKTVNVASRYEQCRTPAGGPHGVVRISDALYARLGQSERDLFLATPVTLIDKHDRTYAAHLSTF